ncbi:peptidase S1 and S6 chymotrypsin/Hap [Halothece sp. PCC 7418]|uniref:S1C family serine protease n=1 Tax=Halothece sp. (strain PCC 7418) TaxID=65093 RepID=UPI0002A07E0E|nr:trypsin-like peptidase domain-containing protein [Halothece sp. PCC 7418]AFZ43802.1 peptidase S1 and S6 chymotrypsin/Hap [Halothece sp. PCC 7418]
MKSLLPPSLLIALASHLTTSIVLHVEALPITSVTQAEITTLTPDISAAIVTLQGVGGKGTGSIIKASGIVLTSEHVIRNARRGQVSILTYDGTHYPGKVIAVDTAQDLALIQILANKTFPTLPLADAENIEVGETVYALDNPSTSLDKFITGQLQKIEAESHLYTNLKLSPGDSGGALLNAEGKLIGINRAIVRFQSSEQSQTFGMATHVNTIREFLENPSQPAPPLQETAKVSDVNLGITVQPETLEITQIEPNSLADQWGLKTGDQIVGYNYRRIDNLNSLQAFLATNPDEILLFIRRKGYLVRLRFNL